MGFIIPTCKETLTNTIFLSTLKKALRKNMRERKLRASPQKRNKFDVYMKHVK